LKRFGRLFPLGFAALPVLFLCETMTMQVIERIAITHFHPGEMKDGVPTGWNLVWWA
jgi:hypothetical protein